MPGNAGHSAGHSMDASLIYAREKIWELPVGALLKRFLASATADSMAENILFTSFSEYSYASLFEQLPRRRTIDMILIVRASAMRTNFSRFDSFFVAIFLLITFVEKYYIMFAVLQSMTQNIILQIFVK